MNLIVCIPTFNEELNIKKCLNKLKWVKKVYLLDGNSSDKTLLIAKKFKNTKIIKLKKNIDYTKKLNLLLDLTKNKWIFILDADYVLTKEIIKEIKKINFKALEKKKIYGIKIKIFNRIFNKVINENIYPKKTLIFRNNECHYRKIGHSEKLYLNSKKIELKESIMHENFNDISNFSKWKKNQIKYSVNEGYKICNKKILSLRTQDLIRRFPPLNIFLLLIYLIISKKILFYGKAGIFYLFQRIFYETVLTISILKNYFKKLKFKS